MRKPFFAIPLLAGLSLGAAIGARGAVVRAAETPANTGITSSCIITPSDIEGVQKAQVFGLSTELSARKVLLTKTIGCAKADVQNLQGMLAALTVESDNAVIQSRLSGKLSDAQNFYDIELEKLGGAGIAATQAIAKEVLDWRQANYEPLADEIDNYMIWEKNQPLFMTATNRMNQIKGIVTFLERAGSNTDLENSLGQAEGLVTTAEDANKAARDAFIRGLSPAESIAAIKRSLDSLSTAYQKFFDLSTMVQGILTPQTSQPQQAQQTSSSAPQK